LVALALAAVAAGFGIRAWILTPGGGGQGPTYTLSISGELSQTGNFITLYTTCSNETGTVQTLQLEDGTTLDVFNKCPNPRNQCEMAFCDSNEECTTALVNSSGCADNFDCESYQECEFSTCSCVNSTVVPESSSLWFGNTFTINVTSNDGGLTDPNSWSVTSSYWRTAQRGNETWVVLNTLIHYTGNVQTASTTGLAILSTLPLPIDTANPVLQNPGTNPSIGSAWTETAAGFTGLVVGNWNSADEIWINVHRASTTSGVSGDSFVAIWSEYPTP
jgi:hypothetical protein